MTKQLDTFRSLKDRWRIEVEAEGPPALRMRSERHLQELESGPERRVRELRDKWRRESANQHDRIPDERREAAEWIVLKECADELTALLGDEEK